MTIPTEAIEQYVAHVHGDVDFDALTEAEQSAALVATKDILEAALPHIRKQLAQEIREAQAQKMRETPFDPFNTDPIDAGYIAGLHEAARIVEGNQ